jgi:hypothetical protein
VKPEKHVRENKNEKKGSNKEKKKGGGLESGIWWRDEELAIPKAALRRREKNGPTHGCAHKKLCPSAMGGGQKRV